MSCTLGYSSETVTENLALEPYQLKVFVSQIHFLILACLQYRPATLAAPWTLTMNVGELSEILTNFPLRGI